MQAFQSSAAALTGRRSKALITPMNRSGSVVAHSLLSLQKKQSLVAPSLQRQQSFAAMEQDSQETCLPDDQYSSSDDESHVSATPQYRKAPWMQKSTFDRDDVDMSRRSSSSGAGKYGRSSIAEKPNFVAGNCVTNTANHSYDNGTVTLCTNEDRNVSNENSGSADRRVSNENSINGGPLSDITNTPLSTNEVFLIPEWDGCSSTAIIRCLKAIDKEQLKSLGLREFYKSYSSWEKLTSDQRNKTVSYFRSLSEDLQEQVIADAQQAVELPQNTQTTKDDIARLLHLFKEPLAQRHWTNLHRILTRAELDARKATGAYAEAANPLSYLAEIFNNYDEFTPQNVMVEYFSPGVDEIPMKMNPYQASSPEWAYLATFTHDLEPTNLTRRHIIRGEDWIKSTWTDCRKYLHQMFVNYNRSGQHDDDMDEWGSEKELRRWTKAARKPSNSGSIIRFMSAMIYSIGVLDLCDFESIGRKMPKGTGVDATVENGAVVPAHKKKKRRGTHNAIDHSSQIVSMLAAGDEREAKISALRLFLEFGSEKEKKKAKRELAAIAFGSAEEGESDTSSTSSSD